MKKRPEYFKKGRTILSPGAYTERETEVCDMCRINLRRLVGISAACFGAGIFLSFLLPGYFLAFVEAAVVIIAGILLLGRRP